MNDLKVYLILFFPILLLFVLGQNLLTSAVFAPCKGIWIPESRNLLLLESWIRGNFAYGIRNSGLWNPEYSSRFRNHTNDWNPESKFHWQRLESSNCTPDSTAWNPESQTVLDILTWGRLQQCLMFWGEKKDKKRTETKIKAKEREKRKRYTYLMRKNAAIITSIRIAPTRPATIHIKLDLEGSGFWAS